MNKVIHPDYLELEKELDACISQFQAGGDVIFDERNQLRKFDLNGQTIVIKSFRIPNLLNRIIYGLFRQGKARRSYEFSRRLNDLGIETPKPIAYYEFGNKLFFGKSYYISSYVPYDLTYRELIRDLNYPEHEKILRAFTRFTFELHEKGIEFLDHSPGNTLIMKKNGGFDFFLVDLNRMKFRSMDLKDRLKNFRRLTKHKAMVEVMSDEYSRCMNMDYEVIFPEMWRYTQTFRRKLESRRKLKKKLKFWKN